MPYDLVPNYAPLKFGDMRRGSRISGAPVLYLHVSTRYFGRLRINNADIGNPPALQPVERVLSAAVKIITFVGPGAT